MKSVSCGALPGGLRVNEPALWPVVMYLSTHGRDLAMQRSRRPGYPLQPAAITTPDQWAVIGGREEIRTPVTTRKGQQVAEVAPSVTPGTRRRGMLSPWTWSAVHPRATSDGCLPLDA